jgi:class 3 adenylate cyclase
LQGKYEWKEPAMRELLDRTARLDKKMMQSRDLANQLFADIQADSNWSGQHRDEFIAWMDLLHQYHDKVAQAAAAEATNGLREFVNHLTSYYSDSEVFKSLREIS